MGHIDKVLREELLTGFLTGRGYNKTAKEVETGEDMLVPADMTYKEWEEKYVHIEAE